MNESTLFVYGTLLDPACRERLLGHPVAARAVRLEGYRVARGRYFYLVTEPGALTEGLLLLGLSAADFAILDRYEELPRLYTREIGEAIAQSGEKLACWVYMPTRTLIES